jgi:hypothetical protein
MTSVNSDFDEMLRRALHAEADFIEPADGGLDRIRQRAHAPWLVRQASLMLTECVDLARLIMIRLEPYVTSARAASGARGGAWAAFVGVLSSTVSILAGLVMPSRRSRNVQRTGPAGPSRSRAHAGPKSSLSWLRPALAVAGAVVIVVAGVFGLAQVRSKLVLELFPSSNSPASSGASTSNGGSQVPTLNGQSRGGIVPPAISPTSSPRPSPTTSCSSSPTKQQASPSPAPSSGSPSPAPTSPSPTPTTPTPTDTTPTPTSSSGSAQTAAISAGTTGIQTVAKVASSATAGCGSAKPRSTASS